LRRWHQKKKDFMPRPPIDFAPAKRPMAAEAFNQAAALYQRGDLPGARRMLRPLLRKQPDHFDGLHLMGLIEAQRGHHKDAEILLRQAVRINPQSAEAQSNRGNVLRELKRYEEAVQSYDLALQIRPNYANALNSRAIAQMAMGHAEDALASYDKALAIDPGFGTALYNRAIALAQLRRFDAAIADYDKMLSLDPSFLQAHVDRGNALAALGRVDDAVASYDKALARQPGFTGGLFNRALALLQGERFEEALAGFDAVLKIEPALLNALDSRGNTLLALGRPDDALASFDRALKIDPDFAAGLNNKGFVLLKLRRSEEALACFDRALKINPAFSGALNNRGNALLAVGRAEQAQESFDRAVAANPDAIDSLANRGTALMAAKRFDSAIADFEQVVGCSPEYPYASGNLLYSKMHCCDWRSYDELKSQVERSLRNGAPAILPFAAAACLDSAEEQLRAAKTWVADVGLPRAELADKQPYAHEKIRVAYLSAQFKVDPIAVLITELIGLHDRARFEIVAISYGPNDGSEMRVRLERAFDSFHDLQDKSDREIAEFMRALEIDIAIELTGFTENCRPGILALRPAPIQVNYLGYLATTGVDFIDYVLADPFVLPQDQAQHFEERIAYLPDTFLATDSTRKISDASPSRAEMGLPDDGFVFCCFNSRHKLTPNFFAVWMRLLRAVDGSVLWVAGGNAASVQNLRREAEARGVAPERLVFMPHVSKSEDYLARYRLADLFLDTLPYNAITTASDALWAGLPVLTCLGQTFAGRGAASMLNAVGMPELIADSLESYETIALSLAREPAKLADMKNRLTRDCATFPLFNTDRFRRNLEAAFTTMWQRHQRGEPPATFSVSPNL
jgi:protein O-GlcNAc transferase